MLSVTGEDVDLSNIDYANVKHVGIDPGTSVSNANVPEDVTVDNFGAINGGTFAGEVRLLDTGTITGTGTINAGTFTGTITGSGTINAGDFTQATFSNFTGTINCGTFGGYTIADGTLTITAPIEVTDDMLAGISTVNVTATGEITGGTLNGDASMETMTVDACGMISGGTFSGKMVVHNRGEIAGGTLNGTVWNYATISGGTFKGYIGNFAERCVIRGKSAGSLKIDCGIGYYSGIPAQLFQPCEFGPNASIVPADVEGTIEVAMTVDGVETVVNYGADILDALGASPTSLWYRVNADGTRSLVKEGEAFASLQKEAYTSSPLLPKPEIVIDYRNESWSVTLTEEEVPEGVDVTAMDINFALSGEEHVAYASMPGFSGSWGLNLIGGIWGITFPTDKDTTLDVFYSFAVADANGNETDVAYGEWVEWVIPARPDINVDTVYPGYNEMTVTLDAEPYEVYLESVDGSTVIYDADDGVVDGCIHGLTEGTEYSVHFRVPPTEDFFASLPNLHHPHAHAPERRGR